MAGVLEHNRRRVALALTLTGLGLIMCGIILIGVHQYHIATVKGDYYKEVAKTENLPLAKIIRDTLWWLWITVGIFAVGSLALIRWSRRFRKQLLRKPKPPTPVEDVWSMHRLPGESDRPGRSDKYES